MGDGAAPSGRRNADRARALARRQLGDGRLHRSVAPGALARARAGAHPGHRPRHRRGSAPVRRRRRRDPPPAAPVRRRLPAGAGARAARAPGRARGQLGDAPRGGHRGFRARRRAGQRIADRAGDRRRAAAHARRHRRRARRQRLVRRRRSGRPGTDRRAARRRSNRPRRHPWTTRSSPAARSSTRRRCLRTPSRRFPPRPRRSTPAPVEAAPVEPHRRRDGRCRRRGRSSGPLRPAVFRLRRPRQLQHPRRRRAEAARRGAGRGARVLHGARVDVRRRRRRDRRDRCGRPRAVPDLRGRSAGTAAQARRPVARLAAASPRTTRTRPRACARCTR